MARHRSERPVSLVPTDRRPAPIRKRNEPSGASDGPDEIEILEERRRGDPALSIQHLSTDEDPLVPVREPSEAGPETSAPLDDAKDPTGGVEAETKRAAGDRRVRHDPANRGVPSRFEAGVRVQEENHRALRCAVARVHLMRTPRRLDQDRLRAEEPRGLDRSIRRSAVHHDSVDAGTLGRAERALDRGPLVQGRDDDTEGGCRHAGRVRRGPRFDKRAGRAR